MFFFSNLIKCTDKCSARFTASNKKEGGEGEKLNADNLTVSLGRLEQLFDPFSLSCYNSKKEQ